MKSIVLVIGLFLFTCLAAAQSDTQIFLFDLDIDDKKIKLSEPKNISNAEGYNSQPYFLAKNALLFAGNSNDNTEIIKYVRGKKSTFNTPTSGGEYSPQMIPNDRAVSAVRLDPDGKQRLYRYEPRNAESSVLVKDAVIAYYTWADAETIVSADIINDSLKLFIHNIRTRKSIDVGVTAGRSFHKIPDSELISFLSRKNDTSTVYSLNVSTRKIKRICELPKGAQDIAWTPSGRILATSGNTVYMNTKNDTWEILKRFENPDLQVLSRIAVNSDGNQIALVGSKIKSDE